MKVNKIERGMSIVSVEGKITFKSEPRRVRTRYGPRSVADAKLEDETGTISLTLWEQQIDLVDLGDVVRIKGDYVNEFRNQLQLNVPRSGIMEVVSKGSPEEDILEL